MEFKEEADSNQRALNIKNVLSEAAQLSVLTSYDVQKHVLTPAVESTENWCVAAFTAKAEDFEKISGGTLTTRFMQAIETTEGRTPKPSYSNIDKCPERRHKYCHQTAGNTNRILNGCNQFAIAFNSLKALDN